MVFDEPLNAQRVFFAGAGSLLVLAVNQLPFGWTNLYDMHVIHFEDLELLKSHAAARDR